MKTCSSYILVLLIVICVSITCISSAPKVKKKQKKQPRMGQDVTLESLYKRVQYMNKKNNQALKRIARLQQNVQQLSTRMDRIGASLGRFADDPTCPDNTPGFYHASKYQSCYHLEPRHVLMNWTDAQVLCQRLSKKANLVSIQSEGEQFFLQSKWQNERGIGSLSRFWTNGKRNGKKWTWGESDVKMKYTNWVPTAEHNNDEYQCAGVFSSEAYLWAGIACWAPLMVTCEIELHN